MSENIKNNSNLITSETGSIESKIAVPTYIKFLDSTLFPLVLIPIFTWLFFSYYFKYLPNEDYKILLKALWLVPIVIVLLIWGIEIVTIFILKLFNIKVYENNDNGFHIKKIKELYFLFKKEKSIKRFLIMFVIWSRYFITIGGGWAVFGGIICFFSVS